MASKIGDPGFWVTTPSVNGGSALACGGELDMATAAALRDATEHLTTDVIIDFSAVTFCDSSGIAALTALATRLRSSGAHVRLDNVRPEVARTFAICGVTEILGVATANEHAAAE